MNPNLEPPSKSRLSSNNGETLHRYDPVPSDKVKYSLRSAHSSMGASSDTWSVFSQSSFEGKKHCTETKQDLVIFTKQATGKMKKWQTA